MIIELTRFRVKEGKEHRVDEWLEFLNEYMEDVLLTLEDEKMYVENIFRETVDSVDYLYWYSIEGEGGQDVENSEHWVDQKHLKYWKECIDESYEPVDLVLEVTMIPKRIRENLF
ncbi:DUF6176 family protein [Alkalibacillus haloalkaliphilus]|uniref:DUF6176 family protein n=1 Tax=Alkalibacillus haloalkaliphilus TaxID=94136 RepID=UPI00030131B2|nr:DUF6176 family protein [Alkalibacillus haloalkaliphilus]